jgi:hypothetical protein
MPDKRLSPLQEEDLFLGRAGNCRRLLLKHLPIHSSSKIEPK